jgi:glutamine cyclotransferase
MHQLFRHLRLPALALLALLTLSSCGESPPAKLTYQVVSSRPHDPDAYTQGLQLKNDRLFESTGLYGESTLREIEATTGKILRKRPLAKNIFGEGLTLIEQELFVLTWKENTAFVFDPETFKLIRSHTYQGEGWGLTDNGKDLIMSNGSNELKFINPKNFSTLKTLTVLDGNAPVKNLNELEWINGEIFANIYMSDKIARISPDDGQVTGWLDLTGLRQQLTPPHRAEVLNGITLDTNTGNLLVTGKYWPKMFEIKISEH